MTVMKNTVNDTLTSYTFSEADVETALMEYVDRHFRSVELT